MKFGILLLFRGQGESINASKVFAEAMAEVDAAERLGFDTCYVPEHHLAPDGTMPRALMFAAAILGRTSRLRVGTAVLQLNVHHPLALAEEVSVLDNLSRGRFRLGVGLSPPPDILRIFGADANRRVSRFEEIIQVLRQASMGRPFSYHGAHFHLENVQVTPAPFTPDGPPIWIGARVPPALERTGRIADGWISDPMHSIDVMKKAADIYRQSAAANGRQSYVVLIRDTWVATTREEVRKIWWPHVKAYHNYYKFVFDRDWEPWISEIQSPDEWTFDRVAPGRLICGTVEDVITEIERYEKIVGCDEIVFSFRYATGPDPNQSLRAIELLGREVLPYFRQRQTEIA